MCNGASISSCLLECSESEGVNIALGCPAQVSPATVLEQQSSMAANATTLHRQSCCCMALVQILNKAAHAIMLCHPLQVRLGALARQGTDFAANSAVNRCW